MSIKRVQYCVTCNISCGKMRFCCPKCSGVLVYLKICRKCNLPHKPLTSTAKNLSLFHTTKYNHFDATEHNKMVYFDDRKVTYCNEETCARPAPKNTGWLDYMYSQLGENPTKNAIKRFIRRTV